VYVQTMVATDEKMVDKMAVGTEMGIGKVDEYL
jgi:hypothetical protein